MQRIVGLLLMIFSLTMLPPIAVSMFYGEPTHLSFLLGALVTLLAGALAFIPVRRLEADLKLRDGFLVVVLFWAVLGLFGAIPLFMAFYPRLSVAQAVFESMSGLTTTGATCLLYTSPSPRD